MLWSTKAPGLSPSLGTHHTGLPEATDDFACVFPLPVEREGGRLCVGAGHASEFRGGWERALQLRSIVSASSQTGLLSLDPVLAHYSQSLN